MLILVCPFFPYNEGNIAVGTNSGSLLRCDLQGGNWLPNYYYWSGAPNHNLVAHSQMVTFRLIKTALYSFNDEAILVPYYLSANRSTGRLSILGHIDQIRSTRINNFSIADIITIGADQWMMFPTYKRDFTYPDGRATPLTVPGTGVHGYAIRYEP